MENEFDKCTFLMINVAAQRARQLMQGAAPLLRSNTRKPAAIAIREVKDGLIPYFTFDQQPLLAEEALPETEEAETAE